MVGRKYDMEARRDGCDLTSCLHLTVELRDLVSHSTQGPGVTSHTSFH